MKKIKSIKPIIVESKFGLTITYILILTGIVTVILKWDDLVKFIKPNETFENWNFFFIVLVSSVLFVWFIMNFFWMREYEKHQKTSFEKEDLEIRLKISEEERMTDAITGIPNTYSLLNDFPQVRPKNSKKRSQFILIDIKGFKKINERHGLLKADSILRHIAKTIYSNMRRSEEMYRYQESHDSEILDEEKFKKSLFQKIEDKMYRFYPGGDEFAFVVEGDQTEGFGFCNKLVSQFNSISVETNKIVDGGEKLSFNCAMVQVTSNDTYSNVKGKASDCLRRASISKEDFSICWDPPNWIFDKSDYVRPIEYERLNEKFDILTIKDIEA